MNYTSDSYTRFLQCEIDYQKDEFEITVRTQAIVLKDNGKVFVGKFMKIDENGIAIFKTPITENMPRKNTFYTASYFSGEMCKPRNWGNYSWLELIKQYQKDFSDVICVYISKADEKDFCLIGVKGLSLDFVELMGEDKPIVAFGPQFPPLKYYFNLKSIVNGHNESVDRILYSCQNSSVWHPELIHSKDNLSELILNVLQKEDCIVVQGPPGTGKTYRMAQIAAKLLKENNSVLVTALTNQALMELAKKEDLADFVSKGLVSKTSLTIDEKKELPNLNCIIKNECNASKGMISLATFYISSGWAKDSTSIPFDYAIMDEASQAILPMIAATFKLAKKIIWIGDQKQLPPISKINEDVINQNNWNDLIDGFGTLCKSFSYKSYMLCDTYRLTKRSAACTGIFYDNNLVSVSQSSCTTKVNNINPQGGPVVHSLDMEIGHKAPENALDFIFQMVRDIYNEDKDREIAVLCKFRDSVRVLQRYFTEKWQTNKYPDKIKIETVDRVQGLTVDFCFFLIPNVSLNRSLENTLFNVATSRAKQATVIVADKNIMREPMSEEVRKYLLKAQEDKFASFDPTKLTAGSISVNVVDKIDLSKFERKRKEIVDGKENIYIVDTNVFVNCPDIISRIGNKYRIVIPAKVLEELDKLKLKEDIDKKKLNEAAKNINTAFIKHFSQMEEANLSLLPKGFDRHNPDCMILSVALKYKEDNPILLTSDNVLQSRASGLGITTVSLKDFLREIRM